MNFEHKSQKFLEKNIRGKKITLMGLGLHGGAVQDALFFIKNGAILTITDLKSRKELKSSLKKLEKYNINYTLGKHIKKDFIKADLIIKNPGVPSDSKYLALAKKHNIPIDTSMGIFFELANTKKLIGITGTKGKSTVATLAYEIIKIKYPNTYLAGTVGVSPLKFVNKAIKEWGVLELSSWQLEDLDIHKKSPHIAVIINIKEDHLDRHKSLKNYRQAKKIIFKYQSKNDDFLIINDDDMYLKKISKKVKSKIIFFSKDSCTKIKHPMHGENVAAVLKIVFLLGINKSKAMKVIKNFKGLDGRIEYIKEINGIKFYNDTTATNPYATIESIKQFPSKKIALILGGKDKNLHYADLVEKIKNIYFIALLPGSASEKIEKEAKKISTDSKLKKVTSLEEAVAYCCKQNPNIVLFSPAAASFNMYNNEFERGDHFKKLVKKYAE